jgi:hypothetical protein
MVSVAEAVLFTTTCAPEAGAGSGVVRAVDPLNTLRPISNGIAVDKVDKDAVLQAGKTQIDRLKAASQEIIFKLFDIVGSSFGCGVKPPRLGLV